MAAAPAPAIRRKPRRPTVSPHSGQRREAFFVMGFSGSPYDTAELVPPGTPGGIFEGGADGVDQVLLFERLLEVGDGARGEGGDLVARIRPHGEDHDRNRPGPALRLQLLREREAVHAGEVDVEQ